MSEGELFDWLSDELEEATSLSRLAARGTVRLVLKELDLDPESVGKEELIRLVGSRQLGEALRNRGVQDADVLCSELKTKLDSLEIGAEEEPEAAKENETPDEIFKRLGWS